MRWDENHTRYFYHMFLGLRYIPEWHEHYWKVSMSVAQLIDIRSGIYYGDKTWEDYDHLKKRIIKRFKMPVETLHILIGIGSSDLSSAFYQLQSFFQQSDGKVRRNRNIIYDFDDELDW